MLLLRLKKRADTNSDNTKLNEVISSHKTKEKKLETDAALAAVCYVFLEVDFLS